VRKLGYKLARRFENMLAFPAGSVLFLSTYPEYEIKHEKQRLHTNNITESFISGLHHFRWQEKENRRTRRSEEHTIKILKFRE